MTNITIRKIAGVLLTVGTFWYSFDIVTKVMSGAYSSTMLIFVVFLVIIGLVGIGIATNFNNILNIQNQPKTPAKPAGKMTRIGGVVLLIFGGLNLVTKLSELLRPNPSYSEIFVGLFLPIVLIGMGIGLLKRK